MLEFYAEESHIARKEHTCEMCGAKISPGQKYWAEKGVFYGEFFHRDMHVHCHKMKNDFCYGEFSWDEITDYIRNEYCVGCEHAVCNEWKDGYTECTYSVTDCPRILKIFSEEEKQ